MDRIIWLNAIGCAILPAASWSAEPRISTGKKDADGFLVHEIECEFEKGKTQVRVLLSERIEKGARYPVVYVLPVEAQNESRYGDGLKEIKKLGLVDKHRAIFVAPTFSHLPWYADHPTDPAIRQESYILKVVVPFIEKEYPALAEAKGRLLLGFSKSGWGAWSLLLRRPDQFAKAVAWDAPLTQMKVGLYGSGPIFASEENFDSYRLTKLIETRGKELGDDNRLILLGVGNFKEQHEKMHALLLEKKIPHFYTDGPLRKHDWHSGWVAEGVAALLEKNGKER